MPQMNFFNARLVKEDGAYFVRFSEMKVRLPDEKQALLSAANTPEQDITLGVRPNHIVLSEGENTIRAMVDVCEMMGSEVHLHINTGGKDIIIIVPIVDSNGNHIGSFTAGEPINFTFSGNVCHIFDQDGNNLA